MKIVWFLVAIMMNLMAAIIYFAVKEGREWDEFRVTHECHQTDIQRGNVSYGVGTDGQLVTIFSGDKIGWLCEDGVTYWRNQ